jgi:predicted Zn-dependent protease
MRTIPCDARRRARRGARLLTPLLLAALLPACATLTVDEERQLGARIAQEVRAELLFVRDAVVVDYVSTIGGKIVKAAGPQPFEYHFEVVEDDEINAFTGPAGHIYVHTETILRARNASELAAVLAH